MSMGKKRNGVVMRTNARGLQKHVYGIELRRCQVQVSRIVSPPGLILPDRFARWGIVRPVRSVHLYGHRRVVDQVPPHRFRF